jgi:hypothetical protein
VLYGACPAILCVVASGELEEGMAGALHLVVDSPSIRQDRVAPSVSYPCRYDLSWHAAFSHSHHMSKPRQLVSCEDGLLVIPSLLVAAAPRSLFGGVAHATHLLSVSFYICTCEMPLAAGC